MAERGGAGTYLHWDVGGSIRRATTLALGLSTVALLMGAAPVGAPVVAATTAPAFGTVSAEDLAQGSWSALPGGPLQARSGQAAVWTGRQLLVWGGESATTRPDGLPETVFANGASYDVANHRWQMMPGSPLSPRQDMAVVWAGDEAVFWGGDRPVISGYQDYANGATFDPATATWHVLPPAPLSARWGPEAFWTGSQVVVFGGRGSSVSDVPPEGASYDPARGTWSKLPGFPGTSPGSPISTTAVWTGHELLAVVSYEHVFPISCAKPCERGFGITTRAVAAAWAPGRRAWHILASTPRNNAVGASTYLAQAMWTGHEMVLLGGSDCLPGMSCPAFPGPSGGAVTFDPATRSWQLLGIRVGGPWPSSWTGQALALLAVGGQYQASQAPFASAGSAAAFDPATATWVPLPRVPAHPIDEASMAWTGRQLLVWGSTSTGRNFAAALAPGRAAVAHGYVEGMAQYCVGPVGSKPPPGTVIAVVARHDARIAAIQFVEAPLHFRFVLPPGAYTIGASNDLDRTVTVRVGITDQVRLYSRCL